MAKYLIQEISKTNPNEYLGDTVGAQNHGQLLLELSDTVPNLISTILVESLVQRTCCFNWTVKRGCSSGSR